MTVAASVFAGLVGSVAIAPLCGDIQPSGVGRLMVAGELYPVSTSWTKSLN